MKSEEMSKLKLELTDAARVLATLNNEKEICKTTSCGGIRQYYSYIYRRKERMKATSIEGKYIFELGEVVNLYKSGDKKFKYKDIEGKECTYYQLEKDNLVNDEILYEKIDKLLDEIFNKKQIRIEEPIFNKDEFENTIDLNKQTNEVIDEMRQFINQLIKEIEILIKEIEILKKEREVMEENLILYKEYYEKDIREKRKKYCE